ncbi:MAG: uncharacterized protein JWN52_7835 [Actinomycetia bacterium]|nr:uncharacterized protein [Actinomycetes bacterium]
MNGSDLSRTVWRKSSHSESQQGACVEVAFVWRKSSRSDSGGGACVEVARADRLVAVRDSKNPKGPVLAFTSAEWLGLLSGIKAGMGPG